MGSIDGAVASAEPDGPATSDSSHSTGLAADDDTTSTTSTATSSTADDDEEGDGSTRQSHPAFDHDDEDEDEDELVPRSPGFAQSAPDDELSTDPTTSAPSAVFDIPAPLPTLTTSVTHEVKAGGADAPASVAPAAPQPTSLAAAGPAAAASTPGTATVHAPAPEPAPAPEAPIAQGTAAPAPAPATPAPKAVPVAAPGLGAAVAYLLKTLVIAAVDAVNAIVQLVAELRVTVGIPWATQPGGDLRTPSALMPHSAIVVLLKKMMSRSLSQSGTPTMLGNTVASGFTMDKIRTLSSSLQPAALALTGIKFLDCVSPGAVQGAITALAAMSLWALLSAALPGLGGLFAFAATGMRIGYRQARAGITLPATAFARFARAGPIGVVRTGSLVSVHTRTPAPVQVPPVRHLRLVS